MIENFKHIVCGEDYVVNDWLVIHNPTLREICDYGEKKYLTDVSHIVMRSYDAAVFLDDIGSDYRKVSDFELFYSVTKNVVSPDCILFPGLNLQEFECGINTETEEIVLFKDNRIIDKIIFKYIVDAVRAFNFISDQIMINPGSDYAVKVWIRQQRDKMKRNARKKQTDDDQYGSLVSSLVNSAGFKYDYASVQFLHVSQLFDAFYRLNKIQNFQNTMTGIYSGAVDAKKLKKDVFEWFGKIDINKREVDESKIVEVKQ